MAAIPAFPKAPPTILASAAEAKTVRYCSVLFDPLYAPFCAKEISEAEAKAAGGYRLHFEGTRLVRADTIELGGAQGEPDDEEHLQYEYTSENLVRTLRYSVAGYILREVKFSDAGARASYWDGEGRRIPLAGTEVYSASLTRDARGRLIELAYFDRAGAPTASIDGVYRERIIRDPRGFPISEQAFDPRGNRTETDDGEFAREATFDDWGYVTEHAFFDTKLEPIAIHKGYHRRRLTYDKLHRRRAIGYFGVDGQLVRDRASGCKFLSRMYDAKTGFKESDTCGDGPDELHANNEGYTFAFFDFDRNGLPERTEYLTVDNEPAEDSSGISKLAWVREPRSVTKYYYDKSGNPPLGLFGALRSTRNAAGRLIEELKLTYDGTPWPSGAALTTYEWDRGAISRIRHFDAKGAPVAYRGIATEAIRWSADSKIAEWKCMGADGAAVESFAFRSIRVPILEPAKQRVAAAGKAIAPASEAARGGMPLAEAKRFVETIRQEVVTGKMSFARAFRRYDPKAIVRGWSVPYEVRAARDALAPEWDAVILSLKPGEVSPATVIEQHVVLIERTR